MMQTDSSIPPTIGTLRATVNEWPRRISESDVYEYARDRKFEETAIALSIMCDTPIDVVERALLDPGAEIVLILAKVAGLSPSTTKAIRCSRNPAPVKLAIVLWCSRSGSRARAQKYWPS